MVDKRFLDEPVDDVLIEGPIHKTMLFFNRAEAWPGWRAVLTAVLYALIPALLWWLLSGFWQAALFTWALHTLLVTVDATVLTTLPKRRISFGPWKAQLFVLLVPRLVATAVLSLLLLWLGWQWAAVVALAVQLGITAAYLYGLLVEIHRLRLTHLTVETDRLPADVPPIRLLHISDIHLERLTRREEEVLRLVQETQPDLILITGDYVNLSYNQDPTTHAEVRQLLQQLSAPYGVYATLGSPPVDLRAEVVPLFAGLAICLLRWDTAVVTLPSGHKLTLLGMDCTHHLPTDRQRLAKLTAQAPEQGPRIFIYHSPELMPEAVQYGFDLYLCGHTHGGQVRLPLIGPLLTSSQLGRRYVMGLYREGRTHLYVSRGVGLEGLSAPRVRFMAPPEMTLVTLRGKSAGG